MYRVFCSTPAILEEERRAFHDQIGNFNEDGGLAAGILFIPVTLRGDAAVGGVRAAVHQNVRDADFYVQILGHSWGSSEAGLDDLFELALDCLADPALPMRRIAVLLKAVDPDRIKPDVARFRAVVEQNDKCKVMHFEDTASLTERITEMLASWRRELMGSPQCAAGS